MALPAGRTRMIYTIWKIGSHIFEKYVTKCDVVQYVFLHDSMSEVSVHDL